MMCTILLGLFLFGWNNEADFRYHLWDRNCTIFVNNMQLRISISLLIIATEWRFHQISIVFTYSFHFQPQSLLRFLEREKVRIDWVSSQVAEWHLNRTLADCWGMRISSVFSLPFPSFLLCQFFISAFRPIFMFLFPLCKAKRHLFSSTNWSRHLREVKRGISPAQFARLFLDF